MWGSPERDRNPLQMVFRPSFPGRNNQDGHEHQNADTGRYRGVCLSGHITAPPKP